MTLPPFKGGDAVTCQNRECRTIYDPTDKYMGYWTPEYQEPVYRQPAITVSGE